MPIIMFAKECGPSNFGLYESSQGWARNFVMEAMIESYEGTSHSYDWMWDIFLAPNTWRVLKRFFQFFRIKII